jgi:hypothetical protein
MSLTQRLIPRNYVILHRKRKFFMTIRTSVATIVALALGLVLAGQGNALAGGAPPSSEFFSITTAFTAPPGGSVTSATGFSSVTLLGPASATTGNAGGLGTNIVFAQVQLADNSVTTSYTDTYSIPYQIDVTLTDTASGKSGVFSILGTLTGSISDASSSLFQNVYTSGSQSEVIGGTTYTFTVGNTSGFYTNPSPPSGPDGVSSTNGTFSADVTATSAVPEPSSIALMVVGALSAVGVSRRRRGELARVEV